MPDHADRGWKFLSADALAWQWWLKSAQPTFAVADGGPEFPAYDPFEDRTMTIGGGNPRTRTLELIDFVSKARPDVALVALHGMRRGDEVKWRRGAAALHVRFDEDHVPCFFFSLVAQDGTTLNGRCSMDSLDSFLIGAVAFAFPNKGSILGDPDSKALVPHHQEAVPVRSGRAFARPRWIGPIEV